MDNVLYGAVATGKGSEGDDAQLAAPGAEDVFEGDDDVIGRTLAELLPGGRL